MIKLTIIFLLSLISISCSQNSVNKKQSPEIEKRYFSIEEFIENFENEMNSAISVYEQIAKNKVPENSLVLFDFTFTSDSKEKLDSLDNFLTKNYGFKNISVEEIGNQWVLNGYATEFPFTEDNLLHWAVDLYCKGYDYDCKLDGYGALAESKNPKFPNLDEDMADQYFDLAIEAYDKGNTGMAIIHFSTVLQINPKDQDAWYSRAIAKDELYLSKSARDDYDKAIEIAPDFVDALVNRGANKDEAEQYASAIKDFDKAISIDPKNAFAYFNRGNSKFSMGHEEACDDWRKAKELGELEAQERLDEFCK